MDSLQFKAIGLLVLVIIGFGAVIVFFAEILHRFKVSTSKGLGIRRGKGLSAGWTNFLLLGVGLFLAKLFVFGGNPPPRSSPETGKWLAVWAIGIPLTIGLHRLLKANRTTMAALGLANPKDQMYLAKRDRRSNDVILVGLSRLIAVALQTLTEQQTGNDSPALGRLGDLLSEFDLSADQLLALEEDRVYFISSDTGSRKVERTCKEIRKAAENTEILEKVFHTAENLLGDESAVAPVLGEIRKGLGVEWSADQGWAYMGLETGDSIAPSS